MPEDVMQQQEQQGQQQEQQGQQNNQKPAAPAGFAEWLGQQPGEIQQLIEGEIKGLKAALEAERTQRKSYERELREAAKKLEENSAARKALEEQAEKLSLLERQAMFYDQAHVQGCVNLRLAFLAAQDAGLITASGDVRWEELKAKFPELFGGRPVPRGHAAEGNEQRPPSAKSIDAYIRAAARR